MKYCGAGIVPADILLPRQDIQPSTWACVACDQYTSQPEYWADVETQVASNPSTLRLMLPECYLPETEQRVPVIHQTMRDYLGAGVVHEAVTNGFVLVERSTPSGSRLGLVCAVDLEQYDFTPGAKPPVRPTEETIASRLPARLIIRRGAPIELSHILLLMDDPMRSVVEPLYASRDSLPLLYDFDLMGNGGHLKGWAIEGDAPKQQIYDAIMTLKNRQGENPLLFAVGDGNHSLATAKAYWNEIKASLTAEQQLTHPARYALAELENIHDDALIFEPIHRVLMNVDASAVMQDWAQYCAARGMELREGDAEQSVQVVAGGKESTVAIAHADGALPVDTLQRYLDDYLRRHPEAEIDYIHGDDVVHHLCEQPGTMGFLLPPLDKSKFFPAIQTLGVLPRKTFSMGHAHEKRFYMECKMISE